MNKKKYHKHKKFKYKEEAKKYAKRIRKKGYVGTIAKVGVGNKKYWKVYKYS